MQWISSAVLLVERRCALSLELVGGLEREGLRDAQRSHTVAAIEEQAARVRACEALAVCIGRSDVSKSILVQLRRDVWNVRRSASRRRLDDVSALLSPDAFEAVCAWERACAQKDASEERVASVLRDSRGADRAWLLRALQGGLLEALSDAAATVWEAAEKLEGGVASTEKRARKREETVTGYALRALTKPTPQGRLATSAVVGSSSVLRQRTEVLDVLVALSIERALLGALLEGRPLGSAMINPSLGGPDGRLFVSAVSHGEAIRRLEPGTPLEPLLSLEVGVCIPCEALIARAFSDAQAQEGSSLLARAVRAGLVTLLPPMPLDQRGAGALVVSWLSAATHQESVIGLRRLVALAETWPSATERERQRLARQVPGIASLAAGREVSLSADRILVTMGEHPVGPSPDGFEGAIEALIDATRWAGTLVEPVPMQVSESAPRRPLLDVFADWKRAGQPQRASAPLARLSVAVEGSGALDLRLYANRQGSFVAQQAGCWSATLQPSSGGFVAHSFAVGFGARVGRFLMHHAEAQQRLRRHNRAFQGSTLAALRGAVSHHANRAPLLVEHELLLPGGHPRGGDASSLLVRDVWCLGEGKAAYLEHPRAGRLLPLFFGVESRPPSGLLRLICSFGPSDDEHPVAVVVRAVRAREAERAPRERRGVAFVSHRRLLWGELVIGRAAARLLDPRKVLERARGDVGDALAIGRLLDAIALGERVFVRDLGADSPVARRPFFVSDSAPLTLRMFASLLRGAVGPILLEEALPDPFLARESGESHTRELQVDGLPWEVA